MSLWIEHVQNIFWGEHENPYDVKTIGWILHKYAKSNNFSNHAFTHKKAVFGSKQPTMQLRNLHLKNTNENIKLCNLSRDCNMEFRHLA